MVSTKERTKQKLFFLFCCYRKQSSYNKIIKSNSQLRDTIDDVETDECEYVYDKNIACKMFDRMRMRRQKLNHRKKRSFLDV